MAVTNKTGWATSNLPGRNLSFTGREIELAQVNETLTDEGILTIIGAGGYGKTAIAMQHAYANSTSYDIVWLLNAESQLILQESFYSLARALGIEHDMELGFGVVFDKVVRALRQNQRFLLIYDNAEGMTYDLRDYLPPRHLLGHVLICTRDAQGLFGRSLTIETLLLSDAVALLQHRVAGTSDEDARLLSELLGCLPLALEQAAAYMTATKRSCEDYIKLLRDKGLAVLDVQLPMLSYDKTVTTTWLVSLSMVASKAARQLLQLLACCAPDDIPLSLFKGGGDALPEPLNATLASGDSMAEDDLLMELARYSLVSFKRDGNEALVSMHRLVQAVAYRQAGDDSSWVASCLECAASVFAYKYGDMASMAAFAKLAPHVLEIAKHATSILKDDSHHQIVVAGFFSIIGYESLYNGNYCSALEYHQRALAIREGVLGERHPDTALSYNNVGSAYRDLGDHAKALEYYQMALSINEDVLGERHPDTLLVKSNIDALVKLSNGADG
jgi:tetratricopeptide (TPR) repeat protein